MNRLRRCTPFLCLLLAVASAVAAAPALRRSSGVIAAGTQWATPYHVCDSGRPGPTVLVVGGVHGNEPAGARAAGQVRHWSVARGRLVVVPRANELGLRAATRFVPDAKERDLNRSFPRGAGEKPTGVLATALWGFVRTTAPDWLLDLHESKAARVQQKKNVGNSVIHTPGRIATPQAGGLLEAANAAVPDGGDRFVLLRYPAKGSLAGSATQRLGIPAMILETTRTERPISRRTRQHRRMVHRLLRDLGMASGGPHVMFPLLREAGTTRVALYDGAGASGRVSVVEDKLRGAPHTLVRRVGPPEILAGALAQFHVLVVPGGSGSGEAKAITAAGREALRRFVRNGGGYVGVCAGAYLAASNYSWSLALIDARVIDRAHWKRGKGTVSIELTPEGRRILGGSDGTFAVRYANGPLLAAAERPDIPDFVPLAHFRSEIAENGAPKGVMLGTPAIVAGRWGRGRVVAASPHLESTDGLEPLFRRAVAWAAHGPAPTATLPPASKGK